MSTVTENVLIHPKSYSINTEFFQQLCTTNVTKATGVDGISIINDNKYENLTSSRQNIPIITSRKLDYVSSTEKPRQSWVVNLDTIEERKLGMVDLHPEVFAVYPRIDILHENVKWQLLYKRVNYAVAKTRAEVKGGGRKPWPQKGSGRARHGSIRSPLWKGGGKAHGPRGPETKFYMLDFYNRIRGLTTALSVKHAQDSLHIVDSLAVPTDDPDVSIYYFQLSSKEPCKELNCNYIIIVLSVFIVRDPNFILVASFKVVDMTMPRNISLACEEIKHFNLMPVYGLNVFSMLKHESLVLTLSALEKIEEKLLFHMNRRDGLLRQNFKSRRNF
ncbi:39S ribosomal protein L4, mitochondrial [Nymphon striatum]|nr:39S ribosomal protein L4, mitochondrial [Nymphon striatum]